MQIHELVWSQDRIDHIDDMARRRGRSKRLALGTLWYYVPSRRAKTQFTTFSGRPTPAGTYSVWSFIFRTEKDIRSRLAQ